MHETTMHYLGEARAALPGADIRTIRERAKTLAYMSDAPHSVVERVYADLGDRSLEASS